MYFVIRIFSSIIRTFYFPNPLTNFMENILIDTIFYNCYNQLSTILNFLIGGIIICAMTYPVVGVLYNKHNNAPIIGYISYFCLSFINNMILKFVLDNFFSIIYIFIIIIFIVITEMILANWIKNIYYRYWLFI